MIRAKLTIYRTARAQAKADVAHAQNDLRQLLTVRQEAVLTLMGLLQ
ncbi:MAG: hypothetical protein ABSH22_01820 [Tepidisphaeraceae bacterium]